GQSGFLQFSTSHYQTPIALSMGFFVWGLWSLPESHLVVRVLSFGPFVYFGTMSYTLYLVHLIAMNLFNSLDLQLPLPQHIGMVAGGFAISLLMASAIWHCYEKPIYALRRYLPYR
ncbi:MAG: acyltransferase family protein, partial [Gammaproteobacteria bacterium]